MRAETGLFPAVLKHWRARRGWSQLDLALSANVSARHVSFLETGRAQPSRDMVLRLGETLNLPLRDRNAMLRAAGFGHVFEEPSFDGGLPPPLQQAIDRMCIQHEPYPMAIMNRHYDLLRTNEGGMRLFQQFIVEPAALPNPPNLMHVLFDPRFARHWVVDWEHAARTMLSRLHREWLARPDDTGLAALVQSLIALPDVPEEWRQPDLSLPSEPTLVLRLRREDLELAFLTTITVFHAPQNVLLDEIVIESYFPFDDRTAAACAKLARDDTAHG